MFIKIIPLLLVSVIVLTEAYYQGCRYAPEFWCSSDKIMDLCHVEKQCKKWKIANQKERVQIALYYESMCPGCQDFVRHHLWPAYQTLGDIVQFTMVPYGNANERYNATSKKWEFSCQHGPEECLGNLFQTCALHQLPSEKEYIPFIACMEMSKQTPDPAAKECAKKHDVIWDALWHCTKGKLGSELEHKMAQVTDALKPPHTYVPWITLAGKHTEKIQQAAESNLAKLICDSYTGRKPPACHQGKPVRKCMKKKQNKKNQQKDLKN